MQDEPRPAPSAWQPLRRPLFRWLFIAVSVSNIGTWMQDVGRAWLMTELTPSPLFVALVQSSAMLGMLVALLPAGAVADMADRRLVLLLSQCWMMLVAITLGTLDLLGLATPMALLALTFASAVGAAFTGPAWQAALPELVGHEDLAAAVTLNSLSFNIARAAGPALGGIVVALTAPAAVFYLNALSFAGVLLVLATWRPPSSAAPALPEGFAEALQAGLRYAAQPSLLRDVLARVIAFALPASALWALLPLIARDAGDGGAAGFGLLLGLLGAGAAGAALALPRLRRIVADQPLLGAAGLLLAAGLALATLADPFGRSLGLLLAGGAWLSSLTVLTIACQAAVPDWVRGRALSIFLLVFSAAMAAGSLFWGVLAEWLGWSQALLLAAAAQALGSILSRARRLPTAGAEDASIVARSWPAPDVAADMPGDRGPVLILVQYAVQPARRAEFALAMAELGARRRAEGSVRWRLLEHGADPNRFLELNLVPTWAVHLRQRERGSAADARLEALVRSTLAPGTAPVVVHWFGHDPAAAAAGRGAGWAMPLQDRM